MKISMLSVVLILSLAFAAPAASVPIFYFERAIGTGTLDGSSFTNALVTLEGVGDTDAAPSSGTFQTYTIPVGVDAVGSMGEVIAADRILNASVFVNQEITPIVPPAAGFSVAGNSILDTFSGSFASYNLNSAIGPITGTSFIRPDITFATVFGSFNLQSAGFSTFTATAVPAPLVGAGLPGLILAGGVLLLLARRRRQQTA